METKPYKPHSRVRTDRCEGWYPPKTAGNGLHVTADIVREGCRTAWALGCSGLATLHSGSLCGNGVWRTNGVYVRLGYGGLVALRSRSCWTVGCSGQIRYMERRKGCCRISGNTLNLVVNDIVWGRGENLGFRWFQWSFRKNRRPKTVRVAFSGGGAIYLSCQKWGGCGNGYGRTYRRCWDWRLQAVMPSVGNGYGGLTALRSRSAT